MGLMKEKFIEEMETRTPSEIVIDMLSERLSWKNEQIESRDITIDYLKNEISILRKKLQAYEEG